MKSGELRTPILQALKTLGAINGTMVSYADVQAEVLKTLGKPDIHFLGKDARGKPTFAKVMANCAFSLKSRGCIAQEKKGSWTLTEAGQALLDGGELPPLLYISGVCERPRPVDWHQRAMDAEAELERLRSERERHATLMADAGGIAPRDLPSGAIEASQLIEAQAESERLRAELRADAIELDGLRERLETVEGQRDILRSELAKAEAALADARAEQRKAEDESARLRAELDMLRPIADGASEYLSELEKAEISRSMVCADDALGELSEAVQSYQSAYPVE